LKVQIDSKRRVSRFGLFKGARCHQTPPPPVRSHNFTFSLAEFSPTSPCSSASFEVNSEPHTGARSSVRLCVGLIILNRVGTQKWARADCLPGHY
jgi:hypothetical protein